LPRNVEGENLSTLLDQAQARLWPAAAFNISNLSRYIGPIRDKDKDPVISSLRRSPVFLKLSGGVRMFCTESEETNIAFFFVHEICTINAPRNY